jgi:hypothetical protein
MILLLCSPLTCANIYAQTSGGNYSPSGPTGPIHVDEATPTTELLAAAERRRHRQQKLVSSTTRLATLAAQLQSETANPSPASSSQARAKLAASIQNLAHSISKQLQTPPY